MKQSYFFKNTISMLKNKIAYIVIILLLVYSIFISIECYKKNEKVELMANNSIKGYYKIASIKNTVGNGVDSKKNNNRGTIKSIIDNFINRLNLAQINQLVDVEEEIVEEQTQEVKQIQVQEAEQVQVPEVEQIQIQEREELQTIEIVMPQQTAEVNTYKTPSGESYSVIGTLSIPKLGIENSILSATSTELLNISLNKFWGPNPNEVGNMVVVGHNYRDNSTRFFSRLHNIQIGDIVKIKDSTGVVLEYKVYDTFVVDPYDTSCTGQPTDGRTEITLITCYNQGTQRFVVKAIAD